MKKISLLAVLATALFTACKKDDSVPIHTFIKAKLNGVPVSFNGVTLAANISFDKVNILSIIGKDTAAGNKDAITLNVSATDTTIVPGTYTGLAARHATGIYNLGDSLHHVYETGLYGSTSNPFVLVITQITPTEVKGTFQGDFINTDYLAGHTSELTVQSFTEGEFDVKIE